MQQTRQRIVEAAVELHQTVGPAQASLSAIAERAGVERQTLYRHFPDERSLHMACSGHYMERNPLPGADALRRIADPRERLRQGLGELYRYYAANEAMFSNVVRDAELHPVVREVFQQRATGLAELHATLAEGLASGGKRRRRRLDAALWLALGFHTWRALVREAGLSTGEAADVMCASVLCAAQP
jgi:AcrR family transcriptional regulator